MPYSPSHVANFMLDKAEAEGQLISPMKLLKLAYIGYGWSLAALNRKIFEEPIYAWRHGPVVRSLYDEFKHFGGQPIACRSVDLDLETIEVIEPRIPASDTETTIILGKVWGVYKNFGAWALRNVTHESGSPWSQVYREGVRDIVIPDNLIQQYFSGKITRYLEDVRQTAAPAAAEAGAGAKG